MDWYIPIPDVSGAHADGHDPTLTELMLAVWAVAERLGAIDQTLRKIADG
ncbi:hypothetical protein ACWDTP_05000 [Mycobacterium sp. NPDC003449]